MSDFLRYCGVTEREVEDLWILLHDPNSHITLTRMLSDDPSRTARLVATCLVLAYNYEGSLALPFIIRTLGVATPEELFDHISNELLTRVNEVGAEKVAIVVSGVFAELRSYEKIYLHAKALRDAQLLFTEPEGEA